MLYLFSVIDAVVRAKRSGGLLELAVLGVECDVPAMTPLPPENLMARAS
jgi:hypothetical protein